MIWVAVGLCFLLAFLFFLGGVRGIASNRSFRSFQTELCELFLLRHMMKKNHPLAFMYVGLPWNQFHPRLLWPVIGSFGGFAIAVVSMTVAIFLSRYGLDADYAATVIFYMSSIFSTILYHSFCYLVPTIQNNRCYKEMLKMSFGEVLLLRKRIEEQWPGFYKI